MKKLKFTTFITAEPYVQRFSNTAPKYALGANKKTLVLEGQIDVDELINSAYDSTVDRLLEQFLNVPQPQVEVAVKKANTEPIVAEREPTQSHVDNLNMFHQEADRLRAQYHIDGYADDNQVFEIVAEKLKNLKEFNLTYGNSGNSKNSTDNSVYNSDNFYVSRETTAKKSDENGGENQ